MARTGELEMLSMKGTDCRTIYQVKVLDHDDEKETS